MVSDKKKKRPTLLSSQDSSEPVSKKFKPLDLTTNSKSFDEDEDEDIVHQEVDIKVEEEPVGVAASGTGVHSNDDIPTWPQADLLELLRRMENAIPPKDSLRHDSRAEKLNWEEVSFGKYGGSECKEVWNKIQKRVRRFRLLHELLEDAKSWVSRPWTNFYRSQKQNRHPDMPRRPLSTYMLFYMEKKDRVAAENPGLEMTAVSKLIAEMYKNLSAKKKQKYVNKAAEQRREYEEKLERFYHDHPEMMPKNVVKERTPAHAEPGPKKPCTPFKMFCNEKLSKHQHDPDFNKAAFLEKCKEQWKAMSDKKKVVWINWAAEEESRYQQELKEYIEENPDFVPNQVKAVLTKDEKSLKERMAGKPEKPPNSGYSLFSRIMLASAEMKKINSKERMVEISKMWRDLKASDKKQYQDKVQQMLDQYKLEYASYLESLPPGKREEELLTNQRKKKVVKPPLVKKVEEPFPAYEVPHPSPSKKVKKELPASPAKEKKQKSPTENKVLYKGEPEPPPVTAYQLFLKSFMNDATHIHPSNRMKEAPRYWQMLPEPDKLKHRKKLNELKQKYIANYEKFLKGLTQDELKEYSMLKANCKRSEESKDDDDSDDSDDSESDADNSDNEESGSNDSSSSSDSSSDSESNDSESSGSDSE